MTDLAVVGLTLGILLIGLLGAGVWVAIVLMLVAIVGISAFATAPVGDVMATSIWGATSSWILTALPLFIWMGEVLFRSRLSENMFSGLVPWLNRVPGGVLHVNIFGSALFAAVSGSSAVTAATIGRVSLPELARLGYPEDKAIGSLAGSATLGFLIPPSILLIVYGAMADVSIVRLFLAGVLPGLLLVALFSGYIAIFSLINKHRLPPRTVSVSLRRRIYESRRLIPIIVLVVVVLGSIYAGYATPTEAAAIGVIGAFVLALANGSLTRNMVAESILATVRTTCMIGFIVGASAFLNKAMLYVQLPNALAEWVVTLELSKYALIAVLTLVYIGLGCVLEAISIIVVSVAVIMPVAVGAGFDPIWFGIYLVVVIEMALITPPIGFNLFVIQGITSKDILYIARVSLPFFILLLIGVLIIVAFPEVVTFLPSLLG